MGLLPSGGPPILPTRVSLPTTLARGKQLSRSPLETFPDLSLDLPLLPSGGPPRLPTRVSLPTTLARGKQLSQSPLETFPDLSLDLPLLPSGGPPRLPTRVSLPTTLARGKLPGNGLLVSPPQPVPTTPTATACPRWCPWDMSTLLDTRPVSVLPSVLDTPTAN